MDEEEQAVNAKAPKNYYDLLECDKTASTKDLKSQYRKIQLICHPDIIGEDGYEVCIILNDAMETLTDAKKKEVCAHVGRGIGCAEGFGYNGLQCVSMGVPAGRPSTSPLSLALPHCVSRGDGDRWHLGMRVGVCSGCCSKTCGALPETCHMPNPVPSHHEKCSTSAHSWGAPMAQCQGHRGCGGLSFVLI